MLITIYTIFKGQRPYMAPALFSNYKFFLPSSILTDTYIFTFYSAY